MRCALYFFFSSFGSNKNKQKRLQGIHEALISASNVAAFLIPANFFIFPLDSWISLNQKHTQGPCHSSSPEANIFMRLQLFSLQQHNKRDAEVIEKTFLSWSELTLTSLMILFFISFFLSSNITLTCNYFPRNVPYGFLTKHLTKLAAQLLFLCCFYVLSTQCFICVLFHWWWSSLKYIWFIVFHQLNACFINLQVSAPQKAL